MKISTIINVHKDKELVLDTLESVNHYMTNDVLLMIDGTSTEFDSVDVPAYKLKGFKHGISKSPYKNVALGLQNLYDLFPDSDWFSYLEYDCLVTSTRFKDNLKIALDKNIWMLGCDGRVDDKDIPIVSSLLKEPLKYSYYLLGACQFFHKDFMKKLIEIDFFNNFLHITNLYRSGDFFGYNGYDVSEHLYPSLCRQFGGSIGVFSSWDSCEKKWHGRADIFPIRWQPEIELSEDIDPSIIHPLKDFDHPIRKKYRNLRNNNV